MRVVRLATRGGEQDVRRREGERMVVFQVENWELFRLEEKAGEILMCTMTQGRGARGTAAASETGLVAGNRDGARWVRQVPRTPS